MLVTITSTAEPASDLGYLLHKHPERVQTFDSAVGTALVFYPEATEHRCTAALLLEVDPIDLVKKGKRTRVGDTFALGHYVNDRPYAASSMLAVALGKVFRTALAGRCDAKPELVDVPLPLEIRIPVLPCRGGSELVARMFRPMGWDVDARPLPLDPAIPAWGESAYVDLRLTGEMRLADALNHLYVMLPVLDDTKHYWVSSDEIDKLIRAGTGWLDGHPERDLIVERYLVHKRDFVTTAADRLTADTEGVDEPEPQEPARPSLARQRVAAVLDALHVVGASTVADLGCGEGKLIRELIKDQRFTDVVGADVSARALNSAANRMRNDEMPDRQREKVQLIQSSVTYTDNRLKGFDAIVLMEIIEHLDPDRLPAMEHVVFRHAHPSAIVVTTPNAEYNVRFESIPAGQMRHADHRFEWARAEFRDWARRVARDSGYDVRFEPVGDVDPEVGPPTQLAVFSRVQKEDAR